MNAFDPNLCRQLSLEQLLVCGADSRTTLDEHSGLNKYGCCPSPRHDAVPLGSCTSSSISTAGYQAAASALRRLQALDNDEHLAQAINEGFENVRAEALFHFTRMRVPSTEFVITPSGTDAEYLCLLLAMGSTKQPIANLVIGPSEVGSGTSNSASGLFFDTTLPSGEHCRYGDTVDAEIAERVTLHEVPVRCAVGRPRPEDDIDNEIADLVDAQISAGKRVVLHIVAHNKTGMHSPSLSLVEWLKQRHAEQLVVVVDAAQGRFSRRGLVDALRLGYLVIVTGSKFYGGPPFAGGVMVPPNLNPVGAGLQEFPRGLGNYLTQAQLPASWQRLRDHLPPPGNPGLLLRWEAALAEIRNYYAAPSALRLRVLREFERLVPSILEPSPFIKLDTVAPLLLDDNIDRLLESKTTVFPFSVRRAQASKGFLDKAELTRLYRWLNSDCSQLGAALKPAERRDLALKFHIGQPVGLCAKQQDGTAVLRVALGGVLLGQIAQDPALGKSIEERFHWLEDRLIAFRRKLEVLAEHWDIVAAEDELLQKADAA